MMKLSLTEQMFFISFLSMLATHISIVVEVAVSDNTDDEKDLKVFLGSC